MSLYRRKRPAHKSGPRYMPKWWYDFTVDGRRFRGSTRTDDRKTAEIIEASFRRDVMVDAITGRRPGMTVDAAFGRYLLDHAHKLASVKDIEYQLQNLLAGLGKDLLLAALTDGQVANYVAKRRASVSDGSVNRELTLLRAVLRMAHGRWGVEVSMPDWKAHWLREPAPRERYLTRKEARRLIKKAAPHLKPAIELSLLTGIRLSNCIRLDWSQVDLPGSELHLKVKSHSPGGKPHFVPLSEPALVLLANMGPKDHGPVFTYRGRSIKSWRRAWRNALTKAKIEDFRWHDLRHTAASWMVQSGVPLDVVRQILGHEEIATTMRYAHRAPEAKRKAVDAIASHWRHTTASSKSQHTDKKRKKRG